MTHEKIMELAKQAGLEVPTGKLYFLQNDRMRLLEVFAKLVEKAVLEERE